MTTAELDRLAQLARKAERRERFEMGRAAVQHTKRQANKRRNHGRGRDAVRRNQKEW